jgi:hypothetical protein
LIEHKYGFAITNVRKRRCDHWPSQHENYQRRSAVSRTYNAVGYNPNFGLLKIDIIWAGDMYQIPRTAGNEFVEQGNGHSVSERKPAKS